LDPDSNPNPDPELITDPDPDLQIISDPAGSGCTTLFAGTVLNNGVGLLCVRYQRKIFEGTYCFKLPLMVGPSRINSKITEEERYET
jgi:hypothetical protein